MDPAALDRLLAAVLDPATARPSGRLRPVVVGWPVGRVRRLRRVRRVGVVSPFPRRYLPGTRFGTRGPGPAEPQAPP